MKYLLDSNIVIALVMDAFPTLTDRAGRCDAGDLVTSAITYAEVIYGSANQKPPAIEQLQAFVDEVPILPFDDAAARAYATLPFKRQSYDRLIAAHALALDLTVVTDNTKHFADVPGLKVENWTL